ncbi:MAG: NAD-dependent epimerase/dehydratase family protein, partial [Betaproteobacteria bacterium]|nr:NAD-dependent epimerase/dehydratase family protein [Betaproteobacteria bacterium]
MHMIVTGGAGFLGQQCIARLLKNDLLVLAPEAGKAIRSISAFDVAEGALQHPKLHYVVGDIADPHQLRALFCDDTVAIIHLAAVVSGTAEADFDLGMRV